MARKPKPKLDDDQKAFIERRVIELGSIKAVEQTYCLDDLVCKYAMTLARKQFKPIKHRLKTK